MKTASLLILFALGCSAHRGVSREIIPAIHSIATNPAAQAAAASLPGGGIALAIAAALTGGGIGHYHGRHSAARQQRQHAKADEGPKLAA